MFGGISRHFFRHVSISKSDEPRGELSLLRITGDRYIGSLFRVDEPVPDDSVPDDS